MVEAQDSIPVPRTHPPWKITSIIWICLTDFANYKPQCCEYRAFWCVRYIWIRLHLWCEPGSNCKIPLMFYVTFCKQSRYFFFSYVKHFLSSVGLYCLITHLPKSIKYFLKMDPDHAGLQIQPTNADPSRFFSAALLWLQLYCGSESAILLGDMDPDPTYYLNYTYGFIQ